MTFFLWAALGLFLIWVVLCLMMLWGVAFVFSFGKITLTFMLLIAALVAVYFTMMQVQESRSLKKERYLD